MAANLAVPLLQKAPAAVLNFVGEIAEIWGAQAERQLHIQSGVIPPDPTPADATPAMAAAEAADSAGDAARAKLLTELANAVIAPVATSAGGGGLPPELLGALFETGSSFMVSCPGLVVHTPSFGTLTAAATVAASHQETAAAIGALRFLGDVFSLQQSLGADLPPNEQPFGAAGRWSNMEGPVGEALGVHGQTIVRTLVEGVTGGPDFLVEHYGRAIAGLLRTNPVAARAEVGAALREPAVVCRFPDPAVAENVTGLLCREPPLSFAALQMLCGDIWRVANRTVEPTAFDKYHMAVGGDGQVNNKVLYQNR